jgi:TATA-box binding protein (TBP) (component of TFIID and TFIIIB)
VSPTLRIVNVVATAALDRSVNLDAIREHFPHRVIHDPKIYRGRVAYYKSKNMEGKVSIFPSGKMISIGTKSIKKALEELKLVAKALKASLKAKPEIQSMVATADFRTSIDIESFLNRLHEKREFNAIYEPEQFSGAIIRFLIDDKFKATVLLFSSGKLVLAGLTNLELVQKAMNTVKSQLVPLS